jgi:hypothetical protein
MHSYLKIRASRYSVPSVRKEREFLEKMREIRSQYEQGDIDRANFVRKMAFKAVPLPLARFLYTCCPCSPRGGGSRILSRIYLMKIV